jgi:hypothetical protein
LANFRRKENFYLHFSLAIICFLDQFGILYLHNTICTRRHRRPCVDPHTLAWLQANLITRLNKARGISSDGKKTCGSNEATYKCTNTTLINKAPKHFQDFSFNLT